MKVEAIGNSYNFAAVSSSIKIDKNKKYQLSNYISITQISQGPFIVNLVCQDSNGKIINYPALKYYKKSTNSFIKETYEFIPKDICKSENVTKIRGSYKLYNTITKPIGTAYFDDVVLKKA